MNLPQPHRGTALLIAMCLLATGACQPLPVYMMAKGSLDANAHVSGNPHVTMEMAPNETGQPIERMDVPAQSSSDHVARVAIIDVDGLLLNTGMTGLGSVGDNPVSVFRERLDAVAADPQVVAVVVRINSPGGGVTATDMMWHDLQTFKTQSQLPVVACLLDVGAGGAYYLATAADEIIAHPTSVVGGIGVILNLYNLQDAMAQFNIVGAPIKAGKRIDLGTPVAVIDEEGRQLLQSIANSFHERFRRVVLQTRPSVQADDPTNFDGRIFTAEEGCKRSLVDSIGYLNDAIDVAAHRAGCSQVAATFYHRANDRAQSIYATTPNVPLQGSLLPLSLPGLDRSRLPSFLYMWQPEPTMEKLGGK